MCGIGVFELRTFCGCIGHHAYSSAGVNARQRPGTFAHAKLHAIDPNDPEQTNRPDSRTREVQAESVAYAVCQHYGLDTSEYSFGYVAGWSSGRELAELKASLEIIRSAAHELISALDEHLAELRQQREADLSAAQEAAFALDNGSILFIQTCDSGYDYTLYGPDNKALDGGQLDAPGLTLPDAGQEALNLLGQTAAVSEVLLGDKLAAFQEAAEKANEIPAPVKIPDPAAEPTVTIAMLIPLETVSNNFDYIGMNASVAKKIDEILKLDEMTDTTSKAELSDHTIVFEHVTFSYEKEQPVLKDVSFTVPDGKVTALAGVSGSGKSTAANLICRFWDITEGQIYLGGVPLNHIPLSALMSQISFVTQNTFLFKKSIRENIMMGNPEATEEEMMQAAKDAVCHDFIMRLPKGYDTVVDKETKLSGGEKQRITLARAILKNAPIVILDEATAYIDADNEDLLQKALAKLSEGKTVLVIAHRLSSIKEADSIVVLEQGKVIDCGTHDELINRCSPYQDMWAAFEQSDQWKMGGVNA